MKDWIKVKKSKILLKVYYIKQNQLDLVAMDIVKSGLKKLRKEDYM